MIPASLRRALTTGGAILVFLALAGATYQGVATALERRQFPHPGRLIDVGGHQLHIHCDGSGSPTVVLEAPAAGMSGVWGWVQPRVAQVTRVCSYDRAGLGWSEAGDGPYDPGAVAPQLQSLMEGAPEPGPYVLAGHGLGAAFATLAAAHLGGQTAALVLIDAPRPSDESGSGHPSARLFNATPWLARAGVLRATGLLSDTADGLPPASAGAVSAFLNRPDHLTRAARELARWDETVRLAAGAPIGPRLPVMRVSAAGDDRVAFLSDPARAEAAVAAIISAVRTVRSAR